MKNLPGSKMNFYEFYQAQSSKVYARCIKSTGNKADADDAAQNIWCKTYIAWLFIDNPEHFLSRTVTNALTDFHRKKIRDRKFSNLENAHEPGESPSVEEEVTQKVAMEEFSALLNEDELVVFNMLVKGYNRREISKELGVTYGWVTDKVKKIRKKLLGN